MKKLISFFAAFLMLLPLFVPAADALFDSGSVTSNLKSQIYYMENLDEGTIFFDKDSNKKVPLAGYAKVLAAIVALEKWGNLDGSVKITEKHLNVFESIYGMATALYEEGETVSKRELFDCLVVCSANDALSIIIYETYGTSEAFVQEMQKLASKIGCSSTSVKNAHGFDEEGQFTTARDVAKIIKHAITYPAFSEAFGADEVTLKKTDKNEERTYYSTNQMLQPSVYDYYHSSVIGAKHTSMDEAGECIAVVSNADGYSYLTVVMGGVYEDIDDDGYDENTSMTDAQLMLDWVYENIRFKVIASAEQTVATVDVIAGKGSEKLHLVPEKETSALVPAAATPASVMFDLVGEAPESVVAPVKAGDIVAQADVYYAGQKLKTINLVAKETVKLSFGGLILTGFKAVIGSVFFLVISFIAAAIAVLKLVLDLKDYFDKERKKSFDPLPSSFELLTEKVKTAFAFGGKKKQPQGKNKKTPNTSKEKTAVRKVGENKGKQPAKNKSAIPSSAKPRPASERRTGTVKKTSENSKRKRERK